MLLCGFTSIRREREKEPEEIKAAYLVLPNEHLGDSVEMCVPFTLPRKHGLAGEDERELSPQHPAPPLPGLR